MNAKKIAGIILVIAGAGFLYLSHNINMQVAEGRTEISGAQQKVDIAGKLFSINPATKEAGKPFTGSAQKQIDEGSQQADQYGSYAKWLMIGGVALIVIGVGAFFIGRKKG
jgi:hypothetical protein